MLGRVPTITIHKTEGCQMYMSEGSRATEIITDQSSEINVLIPNGDDFVSALNGGTATALFTREVQGPVT